ncbi:hypothetical protein B1NLA3E_14480 [Bacillus sp. 1NLA3E]|nr:isoprenylcysteine carboxylmethyltransferase family protein [Bacillus sp. 1NLA3E]AGK54642.1 hypothetical protein B1NLA3E_14480 [Bacillus sp. 1NLA3E]
MTRMVFEGFISFVVLQRLVELVIAKKNEKVMKEKGAIEFGQLHYRFMVLMHVMFFVVLIFEVSIFNEQVSQFWPILFPMFLLVQAGRIWALTSLGEFWNTKIIVLPEARPIKRGPYRYLKHPNYVIVSIELLVIPLLFHAYMTAVIFTILNGYLLSIRIPAEEQALAQLTEYKTTMNQVQHPHHRQ